MLRLFRVLTLGIIGALVLSACASVTHKPIVSYRQVININARDVAVDIAKTYSVTTDWDARTNTVILNGSPEAVAAAGIAIDKMDQMPVDDGATSVFFIRKIKNAPAADIAARMAQTAPQKYHVRTDSKPQDLGYPSVIMVDLNINSLLITADVSCERETRGLIDQLDQPRKTP